MNKEKDYLIAKFNDWQKKNYPVIVKLDDCETISDTAKYYSIIIQFLDDELDIWLTAPDDVIDKYLKTLGIKTSDFKDYMRKLDDNLKKIK